MRGWKRWLARAVSEGHAACRYGRGPRRGFRILMYHSVGTRVASDSYGFGVSQERFASQMRLLQERTDVELVGLEHGRADGNRLHVGITFDDGFKDTLTIAAPLMLASGIPWTVFATPALLGSSSDYLTNDELRELASLPSVSIGSHGLTHVPLTGCSDAQLYQELRDSRRALEDVLGKAVTTLSYPHGAVDQRVREAAVACGYRVGACSRGDINAADRDPLVLCRTEIVGADSRRVFSQKLNGAWDWTRWQRSDPALTERLK